MSQATCALPYVIVVHRPSGRAFTLDRGYRLLDSQFDDYQRIQVGDKRITNTHNKWLPTGESQRPAWVNPAEEKDYNAYWLGDA